MKTKALWVGLLAFGLADWLLLNLVVGPAYFDGSEAAPPQSVEGTAAATLALAKPEAKAEPREAAQLPAKAEPTDKPEPLVEAAPPETTESIEKDTGEKPEETGSSPGSVPSLDPITFPRQSAELNAEGRLVLNDLGKYLLQSPKATVRIEGHADERGNIEYNNWLSMQRSLAVRTYLQALGVAPGRTKVSSFGSQRPADNSGTEAALATNRRVELTIE